MKLSELEERARQEQEERQLLAAEDHLRQQIAEMEAAEELKQEVVAWMVKEGDLDATELGATLVVDDHEYMQVRLRVPDHTDITFRVQREPEGGFVVRDQGRIDVERSFEEYTRYCFKLGEALLVAADEWQKRVESEAKDARREEERERERALRKQYATERGEKYLDLLNEHPILRPILDLLGAFMEEREQFAEDLDMAEKFAASVEARYAESVEQAQYEANRLESERDRLQSDLYDAEDRLSRICRRGR